MPINVTDRLHKLAVPFTNIGLHDLSVTHIKYVYDFQESFKTV